MSAASSTGATSSNSSKSASTTSPKSKFEAVVTELGKEALSSLHEGKMRATYGHSFAVDLSDEAAEPPCETLLRRGARSGAVDAPERSQAARPPIRSFKRYRRRGRIRGAAPRSSAGDYRGRRASARTAKEFAFIESGPLFLAETSRRNFFPCGDVRLALGIMLRAASIGHQRRRSLSALWR